MQTIIYLHFFLKIGSEYTFLLIENSEPVTGMLIAFPRGPSIKDARPLCFGHICGMSTNITAEYATIFKISRYVKVFLEYGN